ncbi:hypothetical protein FOZ62_024532 [Perkinsus olseni]|uniref:Diacylglycerol O-acyltransferase n=1 Tax=Perkinsus olseni TaxID=32597 RepID=A0A7J6QS61_PEROL|nr:hypothetical protein FOZ62_024532 [Perkinsus olseni]
MTAVEAVIENIMSTPFGDELPPTRFVLIHNEDGNTTVVSKLHHALADGASSIMALLELESITASGAHWRSRIRHQWAQPVPVMGREDRASAGIRRRSRSDQDCESVVWQWLKLVPWAIYMLLIFSVLPDSYTSLRPTLRKRGRSEVRCSKRVPLEDLKVISRATGAKVNDWEALYCFMEGGIGEAPHRAHYISSTYFQLSLLSQIDLERPALEDYTAVKQGKEPSDPASLRMGFQFTANMRSSTGKTTIGTGGNESWVFSVPVSLHADIRERIRDAQLQTSRLKSSPAFLFGRVFIRLCGFFMNLPFVRRLFIQSICGERYLLGKTLTVTNVPGPRDARSVCGREVKGMQCYVSNPQTFTVVTYNGQMSTTIVTDAATVDAEMMRECYNTEVEQAIALFRSSAK